MRREPSPEPRSVGLAASKWLTAERYSSTKWANSCPTPKPSLLECYRNGNSSEWGGERPIRVDVRVIAATNLDLDAAVANGAFRQDLLYRLNVFPIEMPPLRERKDDILILVRYFVQRYANRAGRNIRSIDRETLDLLQSYDWPGNIRELQNVIERSIILSSTDLFSVDELWLSKSTRSAGNLGAETLLALHVEPRSEREMIEAALAETRGRVSGPSGAAAKLRVPPSTLEDLDQGLENQQAPIQIRLTVPPHEVFRWLRCDWSRVQP